MNTHDLSESARDEQTGGIPFNIGYLSADEYENMLLPHYYDGVEDVDLVGRLIAEVLGPPPAAPGLRILDLGCGAGRVTRVLAPYAGELHAIDKSAGMIKKFREQFPTARAHCADTETALRDLRETGERFDVIGSFWSMSYPLLECFETTTASGVTPNADWASGVTRAKNIMTNLLDVLAPGGHVLMLFFDPYTEEQRLVTRFWESVHPFPGSGRDHTLRVLLGEFRDAEVAHRGLLTTRRLPGVAVATDRRAVLDWFLLGHLNALPQFVDDHEVHVAIDDFAARHMLPDGRVLIPSGVNLIHFHDVRSGTSCLPEQMRPPVAGSSP